MSAAYSIEPTPEAVTPEAQLELIRAYCHGHADYDRSDLANVLEAVEGYHLGARDTKRYPDTAACLAGAVEQLDFYDLAVPYLPTFTLCTTCGGELAGVVHDPLCVDCFNIALVRGSEHRADE